MFTIRSSKSTRMWVLTATAIPMIAGCVQGESSPPGTGRLELSVAPLNLPNVDEACYDLKVTRGSGFEAENVWGKGSFTSNGAKSGSTTERADEDTLCSGQYGGAAGITFIGTCDASGGTAEAPVTNRVWLNVDSLWTRDGIISETTWQNPCDPYCYLDAPCVENADTPVDFNLTIMRRAQQGFFDIGVNFSNIFCSAKLDCQYEDDDGNFTPMNLLFNADGVRDQTAVIGLACTAGPGKDTELNVSDVVVTCDTTDWSVNVFSEEPIFCIDSNGPATSGGVEIYGHARRIDVEYVDENFDVYEFAAQGGRWTSGANGWNWNGFSPVGAPPGKAILPDRLIGRASSEAPLSMVSVALTIDETALQFVGDPMSSMMTAVTGGQIGIVERIDGNWTWAQTLALPEGVPLVFPVAVDAYTQSIIAVDRIPDGPSASAPLRYFVYQKDSTPSASGLTYGAPVELVAPTGYTCDFGEGSRNDFSSRTAAAAVQNGVAPRFGLLPGVCYPLSLVDSPTISPPVPVAVNLASPPEGSSYEVVPFVSPDPLSLDLRTLVAPVAPGRVWVSASESIESGTQSRIVEAVWGGSSWTLGVLNLGGENAMHELGQDLGNGFVNARIGGVSELIATDDSGQSRRWVYGTETPIAAWWSGGVADDLATPDKDEFRRFATVILQGGEVNQLRVVVLKFPSAQNSVPEVLSGELISSPELHGLTSIAGIRSRNGGFDLILQGRNYLTLDNSIGYLLPVSITPTSIVHDTPRKLWNDGTLASTYRWTDRDPTWSISQLDNILNPEPCDLLIASGDFYGGGQIATVNETYKQNQPQNSLSSNAYVWLRQGGVFNLAAGGQSVYSEPLADSPTLMPSSEPFEPTRFVMRQQRVSACFQSGSQSVLTGTMMYADISYTRDEAPDVDSLEIAQQQWNYISSPTRGWTWDASKSPTDLGSSPAVTGNAYARAIIESLAGRLGFDGTSGPQIAVGARVQLDTTGLTFQGGAFEAVKGARPALFKWENNSWAHVTDFNLPSDGPALAIASKVDPQTRTVIVEQISLDGSPGRTFIYPPLDAGGTISYLDGAEVLNPVGYSRCERADVQAGLLLLRCYPEGDGGDGRFAVVQLDAYTGCSPLPPSITPPILPLDLSTYQPTGWTVARTVYDWTPGLAIVDSQHLSWVTRYESVDYDHSTGAGNHHRRIHVASRTLPAACEPGGWTTTRVNPTDALGFTPSDIEPYVNYSWTQPMNGYISGQAQNPDSGENTIFVAKFNPGGTLEYYTLDAGLSGLKVLAMFNDAQSSNKSLFIGLFDDGGTEKVGLFGLDSETPAKIVQLASRPVPQGINQANLSGLRVNADGIFASFKFEMPCIPGQQECSDVFESYASLLEISRTTTGYEIAGAAMLAPPTADPGFTWKQTWTGGQDADVSWSPSQADDALQAESTCDLLFVGADDGAESTIIMSFDLSDLGGTSTELPVTIVTPPADAADPSEGGPFPPVSLSSQFVLDPTAGPGNVWSPPTTQEVWQYATYRGEEQLSCNGISCGKKYWNIAFGFDPNAQNCSVEFLATASVNGDFVDGAWTTQGRYPAIHYRTQLTTGVAAAYVEGSAVLAGTAKDGTSIAAPSTLLACSAHGLDNGDGRVITEYLDPTFNDEPVRFCHWYDGKDAAAELSLPLDARDASVGSFEECTTVFPTPTAKIVSDEVGVIRVPDYLKQQQKSLPK
jgi:hypothetical protein